MRDSLLLHVPYSSSKYDGRRAEISCLDCGCDKPDYQKLSYVYVSRNEIISMATDEDYNKLGRYVAERLNKGAAPEAIKRELVMRGFNPAAVDYVFKRIETNGQGKDFMRYGKILGIALIVILIGVGIYYASTQ